MKPKGALSLDLDNLWAYLQAKGETCAEAYPSYLSSFIPCILELLEQLKLRITFFVVGRDAEREGELISRLALEGHELANHSFAHRPGLSKEALAKEIERAERAIEACSGKKPIGFRAPAFSFGSELARLLAERGYRYDSSLFPSCLSPLARAYYLAKTGSKRTGELYGSFRDCFKPIKPFLLRVDEKKRLVELPVTTLPFLRLPFHMSYLIYLCQLSPGLMRAYLQLAIRACLLSGTPPNFLLHPTDLLSGREAPSLSFFPGMKLSSTQKRKAVFETLSALQERFELLPLEKFLDSLDLSKLREASL